MTGQSVWRIEVDLAAARTIRKLALDQRRRISTFLKDRLAKLDDPKLIGAALQGDLTGLWKYRVGDFRLIAKIEYDRLVILIVKIGHRGDIYR